MTCFRSHFRFTLAMEEILSLRSSRRFFCRLFQKKRKKLVFIKLKNAGCVPRVDANSFRVGFGKMWLLGLFSHCVRYKIRAAEMFLFRVSWGGGKPLEEELWILKFFLKSQMKTSLPRVFRGGGKQSSWPFKVPTALVYRYRPAPLHHQGCR